MCIRDSLRNELAEALSSTTVTPTGVTLVTQEVHDLKARSSQLTHELTKAYLRVLQQEEQMHHQQLQPQTQVVEAQKGSDAVLLTELASLGSGGLTESIEIRVISTHADHNAVRRLE
eukprot:3017855-Amphidinium_carterae.2